MTGTNVTFPGLGIALKMNRVAFTVFGIDVYWYGLIIAVGFLLAVGFCWRISDKFGITQDNLISMLLFAVPLSIIGARAYYVIFYLDLYRNPDGSLNVGDMFLIRDGGLAIYGGIIVAVATVFVFCRVKKIKFPAFVDLGAFGLLIGQAIGRWGNFVNVEAFGGETALPWRMGVEVWSTAAGGYLVQEVHPTFLYECLWNVVGFILLCVLLKKWRRFDGQLFLTYVAWYGIGRAWIEGLRTDSLYFFGLKLFGAPIRTSQVLAVASALAAAWLLIYHLVLKKHTPEELYCNQVAAMKEKEATEHDADGREGAGSEAKEPAAGEGEGAAQETGTGSGVGGE